jgi:hypothetical protein
LLPKLHDVLEEALEGRHAQPLPDTSQAGMIRQGFIEAIAQVPAVGQVQASRLDQAALWAQSLEEQDELELEEDDRVDGGPPTCAIEIGDPLAHKRQVESGIEVAVEMVGRDKLFQGDSHGLIERTEFRGTQHG